MAKRGRAADGRKRKRAGRAGSVREVPKGSGKWQARYPAGWDPENRGRRLPHPSNPFPTEAAAWAAIANEDSRRSGIRAAARDAGRRGQGQGKYTVLEMCRDYIVARSQDEAHIAERTKHGYRQALRDQIDAAGTTLRTMTPKEVEQRDIDAWRSSLRKAGVHATGRYRGRPMHPDSSIDRAEALLSAAFGWAHASGKIGSRPIVKAPKGRSKFGKRNAGKSRAHIPFPTWRELAEVASEPARAEDRLLIVLLAWGGLRWSEGIGLHCSEVNPRVAELTVQRVYVRAPIPSNRRVAKDCGGWVATKEWISEPVKSGEAATVPLSAKLHRELLRLAATRDGGDALLFEAFNYRDGDKSFPIMNQSRFSSQVWRPAVEAAEVPELQIKDLRAYAASVVVDAGGNELEAQTLLRHSSPATTRTHYLRAKDVRASDPDRLIEVRQEPGLSLAARIDRLFEAWLERYPHAAERLLDGTDDDIRVGASTKAKPRSVKAARSWANAQGLEGVSRKGALRREIVDAYLEANPGEAVAPDVTVSGFTARRQGTDS